VDQGLEYLLAFWVRERKKNPLDGIKDLQQELAREGATVPM
jgi:hypothetical protein